MLNTIHSTLPRVLSRLRWVGCFTGLAAAGTSPLAATEIAAVYAKTFNGYVRAPDQGPGRRPERYVFARGVTWTSSMADPSLDNMTFLRVAHIIAEPLRAQNYVCETAPDKTELIIFVSWGSTFGEDAAGSSGTHLALAGSMQQLSLIPSARMSPSNSAMDLAATRSMNDMNQAARLAAQSDLDSALTSNAIFNEWRDRDNMRNAALLGYRTEFLDARDRPFLYSSRDVVAELEDKRYFVILKAYDFPLLWKKKQWKLLWESRYSISERGNRFDASLAAMTRSAAPFFGRDVPRLMHRKLPEGTVIVGTPVEVDTKNSK